jgi:glycosyltransferase involved in cell wall biosynthesis
VGEIPNYLEDNVSAFIAEPGSIDSFADVMYRALSDKDNAKRVGLNGRKVAEENFSVDVQAKRLVEFLKEK